MLTGFLYPSFITWIGSSYFIGRTLYTYAYVTHGASYYVREIGAFLLFCAYGSSILLLLGYPGKVIIMPYMRGQLQRAIRFFKT